MQNHTCCIALDIRVASMDTISVRPSEVPEYLTDSDFYSCLNIEGDEEFVIAEKHFKPDVTIESESALRHMLSTMQFWGLNSIPNTVFHYLMTEATLYVLAGLADYAEAFPVLSNVMDARLSSPKRQATVAARSESYEFFVYVVSNNDHLSSLALSEAAAHGRRKNLGLAFQILQGIRLNPLNQVHCNQAAENGHLDCLQFLCENGCTIDKKTCPAAASNGHLDCLKYAHNVGFPWDSGTIRTAIAGGHLDCVAYAHENGCPWPRNGTQLAAEHCHLDCLKYALDTTGQKSPQVTVAACRGGDLECQQNVLGRGCKLSIDAFTAAAGAGHLNCLRAELQSRLSCGSHDHSRAPLGVPVVSADA